MPDAFHRQSSRNYIDKSLIVAISCARFLRLLMKRSNLPPQPRLPRKRKVPSMSPRTYHAIVFIISAALLFTAGCSDTRKTSVPFNSTTGKHSSADWVLAGHSSAARSMDPGAVNSQTTVSTLDASGCKSCHGDDLRGGISGVSCTHCHLGGPTHIHPEAWNPAYRDHKEHVVAEGNSACSNQHCHGSSLEGVGSSGPSCSSCHLGGPTKMHPVEWNPVSQDHAAYVRQNGTASCSNQYCHGLNLNGVAQSGPSCSSCHLGGSAKMHPPDWDTSILNHQSYVNANGVLRCSNAACHGATLAGVSGSGPACSSCHLGTGYKVHPDVWSTVSISHGPYTTANGTASCKNQACHGADLGGVTGSGPSCTLCHMGDASHVHPLNWSTLTIWRDHVHYLKQNQNNTAGCANQACHGANLAGIQNSGPTCKRCHDIPYTQNSLVCNECHASPPNGTSFPNTAGKHIKHNALIYVAGICNTCHDGAGPGTNYHLNSVPDVSFLATYNSKSSTAGFNSTAKTCSAISCHGGPRTQTQIQATSGASTIANTPSWYTGSIVVNTQCTSCHINGATEYNNYNSGQHRRHVYNFSKNCVQCHDISKLAANHYTSLNTSNMEGPASATLLDAINYNVSLQQCSPSANNLAGCHDASDDPRDW